MVNSPDWKSADTPLMQEMLKEANLRIDNQVRLAISADQRAAVLAGIFTAAGTAIVAGLISISDYEGIRFAIVLGGSISAFMFLFGAALCIWTALPIQLNVSGNDPENWYDDISTKKDINIVLGEIAEYLQENISENRDRLKKNAKFYRAGAVSGVAAPFMGAVVWLLASSCSW